MTESRVSGNPAPAAISPELQRDWTRAAEQLFGSALSRPDLYQRATILVGQAAGVLRARRAGVEDLLGAYEAPGGLIGEVIAGDSSLSIDGLDPTQIVAAACAMRYREVVDETAAAHRKAALAAATDPRDWVVLTESGPSEGDPYVPYRRLEAQRSTGFALAVSTRPDDQFTGCVHGVDLLQIDPESGDLCAAPVGLDVHTSLECGSRAEREQNVERIKAELAASIDQED